jgi:hypothetical protein
LVGFPSCLDLEVKAITPANASSSLALGLKDRNTWTARLEQHIDQQPKDEVPGVSVIHVMNNSYHIKGNHSMNQACSVCHIPHPAGQ